MLKLIVALTVTEKYYVEYYNEWNDEWINDERHGLGMMIIWLLFVILIFAILLLTVMALLKYLRKPE